jgi:hypothetical protein
MANTIEIAAKDLADADSAGIEGDDVSVAALKTLKKAIALSGLVIKAVTTTISDQGHPSVQLPILQDESQFFVEEQFDNYMEQISDFLNHRLGDGDKKAATRNSQAERSFGHKLGHGPCQIAIYVAPFLKLTLKVVGKLDDVVLSCR